MPYARTARFIALAGVAVFALLLTGAGRDLAPPAASAEGDGEVTLTLLHNNDGESSLLPLANAVEIEGHTVEVPVAGIAAYKAVTEREITEARASGNAVLNVYAGDAYLPGSTFVCSQLEGNPLFDAAAQDAIPYDAHIIGNHEFDSNPDFLERFIRAFAGRPFLSANLDFSAEPGFDDLVDAALQLLPGEGAEVEGVYPIEATDAAGRTVYVVTTAGNYKYVGRLDVVFGADGEVSRVVAGTSYPRPVVPATEAAGTAGFPAPVEKDAALAEAIEEPLNDCLANLATASVVTTEVLLDVSRHGVRARESNAGNLLADAFLHSYDRNAPDLGLPPRGPANPIIAIQNGGGIRQNAGDVLPTNGRVPGDIYLVNTLDVLPFANAVAIIPAVSASDLKAAFELSISSYPDLSGGFLQIAGIRVVYDPSAAVGSRVVSLTLESGAALVASGAIAEGAPTVTVLTNSFLAGGGDGYAMFATYPGKLQLPTSYEQALRDYLRALGTVSAGDLRYAPGGEGRITFLEAPTPEEPEVPAPPATGTGLTPTDASSPLPLAFAAAAAAAALWQFRRRRRQDRR